MHSDIATGLLQTYIHVKSTIRVKSILNYVNLRLRHTFHSLTVPPCILKTTLRARLS